MEHVLKLFELLLAGYRNFCFGSVVLVILLAFGVGGLGVVMDGIVKLVRVLKGQPPEETRRQRWKLPDGRVVEIEQVEEEEK